MSRGTCPRDSKMPASQEVKVESKGMESSLGYQ